MRITKKNTETYKEAKKPAFNQLGALQYIYLYDMIVYHIVYIAPLSILFVKSQNNLSNFCQITKQKIS